MLLQQALSLVAMGLFALVNAEPLTVTNNIAVVHGVKGEPIKISANYLAAFDNEDEPENDFVLVDEPVDIASKMISLRKRGTSCAEYYTVKQGDTCQAIAKDYGLTTSEFMDLNSQINSQCSNLHINKKYCVKEGSSSSSSSSSSASSCAQYHTVSGSDTCVSLSKKYGISLNDFYDLNPKVHRGTCDNLDNGKKYCVKAGYSSSSKESDNDDDSILSKVTSLTSKSSGTEKRKKMQTQAVFTYYWIAHENDYTGGKKVSIKTCSGKTIAKVSENYADALVMEGTGVVGNQIVNLGGCSCSGYKCFETINRSEEPYGITAYGSALRPFVTIAANDIPKGTKIYVPALKGWTLPGTNKKHNGCLLVDDQSWSFTSHHIDFYVYEQDYYKLLDKKHGITHVDIYEGGSCKLLNYL